MSYLYLVVFFGSMVFLNSWTPIFLLAKTYYNFLKTFWSNQMCALCKLDDGQLWVIINKHLCASETLFFVIFFIQ